MEAIWKARARWALLLAFTGGLPGCLAAPRRRRAQGPGSISRRAARSRP